MALATIGLRVQASGFEIKGLAPAMTIEQLHVKYPRLGCAPPDRGWFETCGYAPTPGIDTKDLPHIEALDTVAGAQLSSLDVNFGPGSRAAEIHVWLHPVAYDSVFAGLVGKFGKPRATRRVTYRNGFGATFVGREALWMRGSQLMQLTEYAGSTDTMLLAAWDDKLSAALEASKAAFEKKKAKGDL